MVEVFRNGVSTHCLFFSTEIAKLWIEKQDDGAEYSIIPYDL